MSMSPAQLFLGRNLKTKIPVITDHLNREVFPGKIITEKIKKKKQVQKHYYDRMSKPLSNLKAHDNVMFKKSEKEWCYGTIVLKVNNRSYIIRNSFDHEYRRNRRHIVNNWL